MIKKKTIKKEVAYLQQRKDGTGQDNPIGLIELRNHRE